jgi:Zn-dependent protease
MPGSFRLGRILGIDIFLHWSWAVVAIFQIQTRQDAYTAPAWKIVEYLALFLIVLLHEFGHALACRSVGGKSDRILLWPLGGVAFVQPPPRPGALLWSIAAGPLVNVALSVFLIPLAIFSRLLHLPHDPAQFVLAVCVTNLVILAFNLLPIYPLDGGQIVQALLWFWVGRARSLLVASVIGLVGAVAVFAAAVAKSSAWFAVMALFGGMRALAGVKHARALAAMAAAPRREGFSCPRCHAAPPVGPFWACGCKTALDTFAVNGTCPKCARRITNTACVDCGEMSGHAEFYPVGLRGERPWRV